MPSQRRPCAIMFRRSQSEGRLIDTERIEKAAAEIVEALGDDSAGQRLADTPGRIARMYAEFFSGLGEDPAEPLSTGFDENHREMVVLRNIPFFSICEHHFLPFRGHADIGYVPDGRVVGASKLARSLDILARRPQLHQRRLRR